MLTTISKQFRWEMGHRLPFHDGLCKNIHGHSYEAHVVLTGEPDAHGMVMDYFDLSSLVKPIIDDLDHCFLLDSSDQLMNNFFVEHPMKVVTLDVPSTAENISKYLLERIVAALPKNNNLTELRVRVYETEKTFAETSTSITR